MDINYTENKKNDFFDIFPLREENSAENDVLKNENDFSNDVFNKNATSENKNNFKSNSSNNFLSNILKDKENALIIILIIILLKNSSDKKMILALCYLLI
ncbi:MAG: hypothetical protein PUB76_01720 [Oscillospiraceae bacterium]|nr:hypothetical protein [Oscillospiraceae bacterium]MDD6084685.1 hypothetical protein [Oscillospiraceae bacterium]MDY3257416.1 hypothetical protein [Ruminococcus callidus]